MKLLTMPQDTHREILKNLVLRNLKVRYKNSVLGLFWAFLNPLFTIIVFYVVFSLIIKIQIPQYPLFLLSAFLPWIFFSSALTEATNSIIENANLVKKVYFPRAILPVSYVLSNFINLLLSLLVLLPILLFFRLYIIKFIYFLPVILIIHLIFTTGLALLFCCANVYFRDVSHILTVILMFWFYLTPIVYPISMVPVKFQGLYMANPMAAMANIYRDILFNGRPPQLQELAYVLIFALVTLVLCLRIFKKFESGFVKEL